MKELIKLLAVKFITVFCAIVLVGLAIGCINDFKVTLLSLIIFIVTMAVMVICGLYVARKEGFEL